jgi:predicted PurR-regulated permease PerM
MEKNSLAHTMRGAAMYLENRDDFMWFCLGWGMIAGATAANYVPFLGLVLAGIVMIALSPLVRRWANATAVRSTAK